MNTDTVSAESLQAQLTEAAALLKKQGLGHAAAALLSQSKAEKAKRTAVRASAKVKAPGVKTRKARRAAAKEKKPSTGQSGPKIKDLQFADLNRKERLVMGCFSVSGEREVRSIAELAALAFKSYPAKKANSWTRNSLRRLVRGGLLEKPTPGAYRLSRVGRDAVKAS